jgi:hypothetical protein
VALHLHTAAGVKTILRKTLVLSMLAACAGDPGSGEEGALGDVIDDAKTDTMNAPTQHGPLFMNAGFETTLEQGARFHAWHFELTDAASVHLGTHPVTWSAAGGGRAVDTVIYLYEKKGSVWRAVDKNDDREDSKYAALDLELGQGTYRVIVKGHRKNTSGTFGTWATCEGPGCPDQDACMFEGVSPSAKGLALSYFRDATGVDWDPATLALPQFDEERETVRRAVAAARDVSFSGLSFAEAQADADDGTFNIHSYDDDAQRRFSFLSWKHGGSRRAVVFEVDRTADDWSEQKVVAVLGVPERELCTARIARCVFAPEGKLQAVPSHRTSVTTIDSVADVNALWGEDDDVAAVRARLRDIGAIAFGDLGNKDLWQVAGNVQAHLLLAHENRSQLITFEDAAHRQWGGLVIGPTTWGELGDHAYAIIRDGVIEGCTELAY